MIRGVGGTSTIDANLLSVIVAIIKIIEPDLDLKKDCEFGLKFVNTNSMDNERHLDVEFYLND